MSRGYLQFPQKLMPILSTQVMLFVVVSFVLTWVAVFPLWAGQKNTTSDTGIHDTNNLNHPSSDANAVTPSKSKRPQDSKSKQPVHKHCAFTQKQTERAVMVECQIRSRGVSEPNVLAALRTVPRHAFVRPADLQQAYSDRPLPIGFGQTISQPYIVGYMTEVLGLKPNYKVLEIGTGSGYQAAVCAEIAEEVYTIEIIDALAESAKKRIEELGYSNVVVKSADGYFGWPEKAPFDTIIVTCATGFVPPPLLEQLKPGGRMILPLGSPFGPQTLVLITKDDKGSISSKRLLPVQFVPMLGETDKTKR